MLSCLADRAHKLESWTKGWIHASFGSDSVTYWNQRHCNMASINSTLDPMTSTPQTMHAPSIFLDVYNCWYLRAWNFMWKWQKLNADRKERLGYIKLHTVLLLSCLFHPHSQWNPPGVPNGIIHPDRAEVLCMKSLSTYPITWKLKLCARKEKTARNNKNNKNPPKVQTWEKFPWDSKGRFQFLSLSWSCFCRCCCFCFCFEAKLLQKCAPQNGNHLPQTNNPSISKCLFYINSLGKPPPAATSCIKAVPHLTRLTWSFPVAQLHELLPIGSNPPKFGGFTEGSPTKKIWQKR